MDLDAIEAALIAWTMAGTGLDDQHVIIQDGKPRPEGTYVDITIDTALAKDSDWLRVENRYIAIASTTVTAVDFGANTFALAAHPFKTGDGPVRFFTTGTAPAGAAVGVDYWTIAPDADHVQLATSHLRAVRAQPLDITDAGTGTHSIAGTPTTTRSGAEINRIAEGVRKLDVTLQCYSQIPNGGGAARGPLLALLDSMRLPSQWDRLKAGKLGLSDWEAVQTINGVQNTTRFEARAVLRFVFFTVSSISEPGTFVERATVTHTEPGRTFKAPVEN